jgi:tetratricopeptide (TPR) repeat protein
VKLESNQQTVLGRDDAVQQEITLYVQLGQYDKAIDLLRRRHFHVWEGGGEIHDIYINAHLLRGQQSFKNKRYREALADYEAALAYPENLEVGKPYLAERDAEISYFIGTAWEAMGNVKEAQAFYQKSAAQKLESAEIRYFQALSLKKLGKGTQAAVLFDELLKSGREELGSSVDLGYFAKFGTRRSEAARKAEAHYLMGLGFLGKNDRQEAKAEFKRVLELDPNHLRAGTQLSLLE